MAVAGLVLPTSGPYVGSWNAFTIGVLNDDGFRLQCTIQGQEVNETDAYGMTLTEAIHRGQNWRLRMVGLEWSRAGQLSILQMFGVIGGFPALTLNPILQNVGDRWTKFSQALVLTSILGNPPATPQSLTALSAGFAPNSQSAFDFTSKVRESPLELVLFPYLVTISSVQYDVPFTCT